MQSVKCGGVCACLIDKRLRLLDIGPLLVYLLGDCVELLFDGDVVLLLFFLDLVDKLLKLPFDVEQRPVSLLVLHVVVLL